MVDFTLVKRKRVVLLYLILLKFEDVKKVEKCQIMYKIIWGTIMCEKTSHLVKSHELLSGTFPGLVFSSLTFTNHFPGGYSDRAGGIHFSFQILSEQKLLWIWKKIGVIIRSSFSDVSAGFILIVYRLIGSLIHDVNAM